MWLNHVILALFWLLYGVFHSLLALPWVKESFQTVLGRFSKYYTFFYSIFATFTLIGVVLYQFTIPQVWLWITPTWSQVILIIPLFAGLYIMGALIKKYFFALSGISAFYKTQAPVILELGGWHRYVRHPLYFGTLLVIWSLFFMFPTLANLIACVIITVYTLVGTVLEEKKLVLQFGQQYRDYQQRVPMILPTFSARATS